MSTAGLLDLYRVNQHFISKLSYIKDTLAKTISEYTQATSLHGVPYIMEGGKNLVTSRLFWLLTVTVAAVVGMCGCVEVRHVCEEQTLADVKMLMQLTIDMLTLTL